MQVTFLLQCNLIATRRSAPSIPFCLALALFMLENQMIRFMTTSVAIGKLYIGMSKLNSPPIDIFITKARRPPI